MNKNTDKQTSQAPDKDAEKAKNIDAMLAGTEAGKIWTEIKDRRIEMFSLPDQTIAQYASPAPIEPSKLYLLTRATSVLPAIEQALGGHYTVELADRYVVVSRTVVPLTKK
jgi:hypothetical protein